MTAMLSTQSISTSTSLTFGNANRFATEEECFRSCYSTACADGESIAVSQPRIPVLCNGTVPCPVGYRCTHDKLFRRRHCCGFSNSEGVCPHGSVSYTSPSSLSALQCHPSARSLQDSCPDDFICYGQGLSGYCCKPQHDICPLGQRPLLSPTQQAVKCNLMTTEGCGRNYDCISPFPSTWGFCCSTNVTGWCPKNSRPFLDARTNQPQKCTVGVTTCRAGYSCQSPYGSIVGFCCSTLHGSSSVTDSAQKKIEELPWLSDSGILDGYLSTAERGDISPTRSLATEMMTELSCPDSLTPSYLTDSQLIVECTGSEMDLKPCPEDSECVKAPIDVLGRFVCCGDAKGNRSATNVSRSVGEPSSTYSKGG